MISICQMQSLMEKEQTDKQGIFEEAVEGLLVMTDVHKQTHTQ